MTPYVIFGAGAVGSAIGAYLARRGHGVMLVARPAHAEAIRSRGLAVSTYDETFTVHPEAVSTLPDRIPDRAPVLITVQAPDVEDAARAVAPHAVNRPVVTFQNGIRAEETAAPFCPRLYGGIVRFTSTLLDPGEVRLRRPGHLIVGRHPEGSDAVAEAMAADFNAAGFTAAATPDIASEKALKLLVNLVSGPAVLLRRTGVSRDLARLQVALLEEAGRAYAAAGVRAEPVSGLGLTLPDMIERFRRGGSPPDGRPVYNSTWQNLHHRRARLENAFYHGEIVALGTRTGTSTPVNARVLEILESVREQGLGPEPFDADAFRAAFAEVVDFDAPGSETDEEDESGSSLEI